MIYTRSQKLRAAVAAPGAPAGDATMIRGAMKAPSIPMMARAMALYRMARPAEATLTRNRNPNAA